jgi:hypothetical protein
MKFHIYYYIDFRLAGKKRRVIASPNDFINKSRGLEMELLLIVVQSSYRNYSGSGGYMPPPQRGGGIYPPLPE